MTGELTTAIVGLGQWGGNVLRALATAPRCRLKYVCDNNDPPLQDAARVCPSATPTKDYRRLLDDPDVRAIVIATEAPRHFEMARDAIAAGKHVFVEKPLALKVADAEALVQQATARSVKLMVGHLLEHHPAFDAIRAMIAARAIGDIYYMYTQRLNLGVVRKEENAWWSLAPHDVAVICRLFDAEPTSVAAVGQCYLQPGVEDVVFATLKFADGRMGHVHVSWLDPHKIRKMTLVGTKKMVTWDDMAAGEKVRVYDKGAVPPVASYAEAITLRTGDIVIPRIGGEEPLARQMRHFVDCVLDDTPVFTDGADGLRVVRVLEAGERSLRQGGKPVAVEATCSSIA